MVIKWQPITDGCQLTNWSPGGHSVIPTRPTSCHQIIPNSSQIAPKLIPNWSQSGHKTANGKVAWKRLIRGYKGNVSHCGHQAATNWSQFGHQEVTNRPQIDRKVATMWSSTHQLVTKRPPSYPKEVNEWFQCNLKVVPMSKMVNKCLQKSHQATILES